MIICLYCCSIILFIQKFCLKKRIYGQDKNMGLSHISMIIICFTLFHFSLTLLYNFSDLFSFFFCLYELFMFVHSLIYIIYLDIYMNLHLFMQKDIILIQTALCLTIFFYFSSLVLFYFLHPH